MSPKPALHPHRGKPLMKFLVAAAVLFIGLGLFMILGPAGRVPLMDANRTTLSDNAAAGYCAAIAHFDRHSQVEFDQCVEASSRSADYDLTTVVPAFCEGVKQFLPIPQSECEGIMSSNRYWPTAEPTRQGWISASWNQKFPYPGGLIGIGQAGQNESRTGDRDGHDRDDFEGR